jgi:hypothetical protein
MQKEDSPSLLDLEFLMGRVQLVRLTSREKEIATWGSLHLHAFV